MDEKTNLIDDIKSRLNEIKYQVETQGFGGYALMTLLAEESKLQQELNNLLNKSGKLSQTEADAIYQKLRLEKKNDLQKQSKRSIMVVAVGLIAIGIIAYFTFKKPNK